MASRPHRIDVRRESILAERTPRRTTTAPPAGVSSVCRQSRGCTSSVIGAALKAWEECQPEGLSVPEENVEKTFPAVAANMPGGWNCPETTMVFLELFTPCDGGVPFFQRLLCFHEQRLHFLYFWRAFSKAAHHILALTGATINSLDLEL